MISENSHQLHTSCSFALCGAHNFTPNKQMFSTNSNEQKQMSYCSPKGRGPFKLLVTGVLADKVCCLGDTQMPCRARTRLSSSTDGVEAQFRRRSQKEKTCNVKISLWHLQGRFVCRGKEGVLNQRGVGAMEQKGLSGRFLCRPAAQRFLWIFPGVLIPLQLCGVGAMRMPFERLASVHVRFCLNGRCLHKCDTC